MNIDMIRDSAKQGEVRQRPVIPFIIIGGLGLLISVFAPSWPLLLVGTGVVAVTALIFILLKDRVILEVHDAGFVYIDDESRQYGVVWEDIKQFEHVRSQQGAERLQIKLQNEQELNIPLLNIKQGIKLFRANIADREHRPNELGKSSR